MYSMVEKKDQLEVEIIDIIIINCQNYIEEDFQWIEEDIEQNEEN